MTSLRFSILLAVISVVHSVELNEKCTTPSGNGGKCIKIDNCSELKMRIKDNPDLVRKSTCSFMEKTPLVCCPDGSDALEETIIHTTMRTPAYVPTTTPKPSNNLLPKTDSCGLYQEDRIIGGNVTGMDEFPWTVLIEYKKPSGRGFYCGGVLINPRYVLTAAHCVKGKDLPKSWSLTSVRLGEHNTETEQDCFELGGYSDCTDPPVDVLIAEKIAHEGYNPQDPSQHHDIALLRLSREVPYTDFIQPICLPRVSTIFNRNHHFVAGWGKTENRSESNVKLKVGLPVVDNSECAKIYERTKVRIGPGQLCAGGQKGKDSCRGDSGGSLMTIFTERPGEINWYAEGVVSFGPHPCGTEGWPGVYTRVVDYVDWITANIKP